MVEIIYCWTEKEHFLRVSVRAQRYYQHSMLCSAFMLNDKDLAPCHHGRQKGQNPELDFGMICERQTLQSTTDLKREIHFQNYSSEHQIHGKIFFPSINYSAKTSNTHVRASSKFTPWYIKFMAKIFSCQFSWFV